MSSIGKLNATISRNIQSILNSKLSNMSIQSGQHDFFYVISKNEGITQKDLSEKLNIGKSTTAKAVKQLMKQGYIYRKKDEEDKRFERLFLTESGKEIAPQVSKIFQEVIDITTRGLTGEEIEVVESLLNKILNNVLEERYKDGDKIMD